MRHNGGDTGANAVALDAGHMAHGHAGHIGNGIVRPRLENTRWETPLAQGLVRLTPRAPSKQHQAQGKQETI